MSPIVSGTHVLVDDSKRPKVRKLRLEVKRGPDKGLCHDLDAEPIRIGTLEGCELRLTDGAVSGVHTEIRRTPAGVLIRDLGSTNGTYVDGRRVQGVYADAPVTLRLGRSDVRLTPLRAESPVELAADDRLGDMVGVSVAMRSVFAKISRLARSDSTVLVSGETGTGKELAACALHEYSERKDKPLVVVDCGALPANLIESELLGHERGSFTGAERMRPGAFERANRGTLFLDEIGELPLSLQPALLGVLERREVRRVGGQKALTVDVRVVAATNRDLAAEVARGAFRADLYYRLAIVDVRLPPLRERPEDLPQLIEYFLERLPSGAGEPPEISTAMVEQLKAYAWPGNVRELRNVIERAALLAEPPRPGAEGTPAVPGSSPAGPVDIDKPFKPQKNALVATFERSYVERLIEATGGNIAAAARKAGIDRMYLYKLLDRYGIEVPSRRSSQGT